MLQSSGGHQLLLDAKIANSYRFAFRRPVI
jgi:hypothetical protein